MVASAWAIGDSDSGVPQDGCNGQRAQAPHLLPCPSRKTVFGGVSRIGRAVTVGVFA